MNFSILQVTNIMLGMSNVVLGFLIFIKSKERTDSKFYLIFASSVGLWIFGLVVFSTTKKEFIASLSAHIYYAAAAIIAYALLYFALSFPENKLKITLKREIPLGILLFAALILSFAPKVLFSEIIIGENNIVILNNAYSLYSLYFLLFGIYTFYLFVIHYIKAEGIAKIQLKYVIMGISLAYTFGTLFNLILPWIGNYRHILLGPIFTAIMVVLFAYAITKHGLMNVRLIAIELFTILIIFALTINVFYSEDGRSIIFNSVLLVLTTIFGVMLIRGTLREIEALRELSDKKSEFLSIASHQLRTPITITKGYLSMLSEGTFGKLDEEQLRVIHYAYRANEGMLRLINDFLNLTHAEKGTLEYDFKNTDLSLMIDRLVQSLKNLAEAKNVTLNWQKPKKQIIAQIDEHKLSQVISNLIDNAIKYTEKKGGISVSIEEDAFEKYIRIYIKDNGIGIEKDELETIFDSFERGDGGKKVNASGSGLGLYVAKMIVEGHNGKIWAESEGENKGSTFIIELSPKMQDTKP